MKNKELAMYEAKCFVAEPEERYTPYKEGAIDFPVSQAWHEYFEETIYGRYPQHPAPHKTTTITERITVNKLLDDVMAQSLGNQLRHIKEDLQQHFSHHSLIDKKIPYKFDRVEHID